ncbi:neurogenic locus notch homolog protein 3-like [Acanthaster planci]|uniref:Neurogenic locus notch homolog protein 3-like n=1 Tax=Acanthaster planci TaxID=133434 RepID=A0A8B7YGU4_ACAPL|nr:neurogenic locus notch homolog protein 3-like [Acanthaster planci]
MKILVAILLVVAIRESTAGSCDNCLCLDCNHGTCAVIRGTAFCFCDTGYTGTYCDVVDPNRPVVSDPCDPNPCQHSGYCNAFGNSFTCTCVSGRRGITCQDVTNLTPCQVAAEDLGRDPCPMQTCISIQTGYYCS